MQLRPRTLLRLDTRRQRAPLAPACLQDDAHRSVAHAPVPQLPNQTTFNKTNQFANNNDLTMSERRCSPFDKEAGPYCVGQLCTDRFQTRLNQVDGKCCLHVSHE